MSDFSNLITDSPAKTGRASETVDCKETVELSDNGNSVIDGSNFTDNETTSSSFVSDDNKKATFSKEVVETIQQINNDDVNNKSVANSTTGDAGSNNNNNSLSHNLGDNKDDLPHVEEDENYEFGRHTTTCNLYGNATSQQVTDLYSNNAEFYFKVSFDYEPGEFQETTVIFESGQRIKNDYIVLVICYLTSTDDSSLICVPAKWFDEIKSSLATSGFNAEMFLSALSENTFLFSCNALHELFRPLNCNNKLSMVRTMPSKFSTYQVSDNKIYDELFSHFQNDGFITSESKADRFALMKLVKAIIFASNQVRCYVNESLTNNREEEEEKEEEESSNTNTGNSNVPNKQQQKKKYIKSRETAHINALKQVTITGPPPRRNQHNAFANIVGSSDRCGKGKLKPPVYIAVLPKKRAPKKPAKTIVANKRTAASVDPNPEGGNNSSAPLPTHEIVHSINNPAPDSTKNQRGVRKNVKQNNQVVIANPISSINNHNCNKNSSSSESSCNIPTDDAVVNDNKSTETSKIVKEVMSQLMPFLQQINSNNNRYHHVDQGEAEKESSNAAAITQLQQNKPATALASRIDGRNSSGQYFSQNHTISREVTPFSNKNLIRQQKHQSNDDDANDFSIEELKEKGFYTTFEDPDCEDLDSDYLFHMKSPIPQSTRNSVVTSKAEMRPIRKQSESEEIQPKVHYVTDENGCVYATTLNNAKPVGFNPAYLATTVSSGEGGGNKKKPRLLTNTLPRFVQPFSAQQPSQVIQPMMYSSGGGGFQFRENAYSYPPQPPPPTNAQTGNDLQSYLMSMVYLNKSK